jgi:hypothetical protein
MVAGYDHSDGLPQVFSMTEGAVSATEENTMPRRVVSYAAAVAVGLCTAIALSTNWVLASGACVAQPNRQLAEGGHWYYRVDRINHRKCWYLAGPTTRMSQTEAPEARPSPEATTFSSFFSSLSADFIGAKRAGTLQDATGSSARASQTHPDDLKNSEASRVKWSRIARHSDSNKLSNAASNRQSLAKPRVEEQQPSLGQAERDALFQEFLRWHAQQTP